MENIQIDSNINLIIIIFRKFFHFSRKEQNKEICMHMSVCKKTFHY